MPAFARAVGGAEQRLARKTGPFDPRRKSGRVDDTCSPVLFMLQTAFLRSIIAGMPIAQVVIVLARA